VIAAEGEQKASRALKEAADVIQESPSALQVNQVSGHYRSFPGLEGVCFENRNHCMKGIHILKAFQHWQRLQCCCRRKGQWQRHSLGDATGSHFPLGRVERLSAAFSAAASL
jgi:hypothetical protein